jgi:hypothetical protein
MTPCAFGNSIAPSFLQMTMRMMEQTFTNLWPATQHTPLLVDVSGVCGDHRIYIVSSMLSIRGASSSIYGVACHSPLGWEWFL